MTMQTLCDGCDQPIDTGEPFYTVQVQSTQQAATTAGGFPPPPLGVPDMRRFDFHQSCLPPALDEPEEDEG